MVRVCDAIMGSGKTESTIRYINEHPDLKFVYITPYLPEAERIAKGCKNLKMYEPVRTSEHKGSKILHTMSMIEEGKSIATTHQAFKGYPPEMLALIKEKHYVLIIDENVDVLQKMSEDPADIQMAIDAGYIEERDDGTCHLVSDKYNGKTHRDMFRILKSRDIVKISSEKNETFYYWQLPADLIESFDEVIILTYMFEGQSLCHFLKLNDIPYKYIGIEHPEEKVWRFADDGTYVPEYVKTLSEKIHILENENMNAIGDGYTDLSVSWFDREDSDRQALKNNVYNYFRNINRSIPSDLKMWSTVKDAENKISGKGYTRGFVSFNCKATNEYRDRVALAYCINVFMNVGEKIFYEKHGIDVNQDAYALSALVQWVWRSAIRDGKEIWLYLPSRRMRELFINWMKDVSGDE